MMKFWRKALCWLADNFNLNFISSENLLRLRFNEAALFFIGIVLLINSCKKADEVGLKVYPDDDKLQLVTVDTITIKSFTVKEDSLPASKTTYNLIGRHYDPIFGVVHGSAYTQVRLSSESVDFGDIANIKIDSAVLSMVYRNYYGDGGDGMSFNVYALTEDISPDTIYYSDRTFSKAVSKAGEKTIAKVSLTDSLKIKGVTLSPQLRIPLYNNVAEELLAAAQSSSNTTFLSAFKGILIEPDTAKNQQSGNGAIVSFDLLHSQSKITLYYRKPSDTNSVYFDTLSFDFNINSSCARSNYFYHNYTGTEIQNQFNNPVLGDALVYVQSMAGVKTKLELPHLKEMNNNGFVAINKAEIIFSVESTSITDYYPPERLYVVGINADGKSIVIPDQLESGVHYGGIYNASNQQYSFNVTRHIQQLLNAYANGNNLNFGLYLIAGGSVVNANRLVLKGGNNISLKLNYTPVTK